MEEMQVKPLLELLASVGWYPGCCASNPAPWECPWEGSGSGLSAWAPATYVGDLEEF